MAEVSFLVELVCRQLGYTGILYGQQSLARLKWPLLGCAVSLVVGCGTLPSQQGINVSHPSPSRYPVKSPAAAPTGTQASEFAAKSPKRELPIADNPAIETWVRRFSQEKKRSFQTQLDRARQYLVPVQKIFEQAGLPKDLVFVALVESGFSPTARSNASAVGMWQFISSTGKRFGLEQNQWVDERRHPFKSARAAADYLSFLYDTFGTWELALAAYNAGENGVQGALDQSGLKTFWELSENGYLPAETRDYVPKVLAAVKIIRNPKHYGFHFDPQHYTPKHETVSVPGGVNLAWLEKKTGIPEATLRDHNPELTKPLTPPNCSDYELCVPIGKGETVLTALAEGPLPDAESASKSTALLPGTAHQGRVEMPPADSFARNNGYSTTGRDAPAALYTVKAGDTLTSIAKRYGCSFKDLATLNKMKTSQPLKAGLMIKVPAKDTTAAGAVKRESIQKSAGRIAGGKKAAMQAQKSCRPLYYPVRKGDTLWSIAERFRISVAKLCASNELIRSKKLTPGNVLTICTREQEHAGTAKRRSN